MKYNRYHVHIWSASKFVQRGKWEFKYDLRCPLSLAVRAWCIDDTVSGVDVNIVNRFPAAEEIFHTDQGCYDDSDVFTPCSENENDMVSQRWICNRLSLKNLSFKMCQWKKKTGSVNIKCLLRKPQKVIHSYILFPPFVCDNELIWFVF